MIRQFILSAGAGLAALAGLNLTPATADAHPYEPVPVCRPAYVAPYHHHHHHHHLLFGVRLYESAPPQVVVRPVPAAPVVVVPPPSCAPAPVVVPYRR